MKRFWNKVQKTLGCWEWTACRFSDGYGCFKHTAKNGGRGSRAHRFAWETTYGLIPRGLCVLHRCDNPLCVKPEHLFLGSNADNSKDMVRKGRAARGTSARKSNLTEQNVRRIRVEPKNRGSGRRLARHYKVSAFTISAIRNRKTWRYLP